MSKATLALPAGDVGRAVEQVLQVMYFCDAEYCGPARLHEPVIGTVLRFEGSVSGDFSVIVSESRAARMAADFFAFELSEIGSEQIKATVTEFANIACGAAMSAWMPSANLHFSVPREFSVERGAAEFPHCFAVLNGNAEIAVTVELR